MSKEAETTYGVGIKLVIIHKYVGEKQKMEKVHA